ncbi:hypothetical protein CHELA40_13227 [Chelatococcus asaccharovorans]|nr:hypothetical protein CHELA40_13227 [Chelatococcus asaccharovorans]CAH1679499.1 hypothetical protein CHELA17_62393 [Chelatococcus asaccharovorans]
MILCVRDGPRRLRRNALAQQSWSIIPRSQNLVVTSPAFPSIFAHLTVSVLLDTREGRAYVGSALALASHEC